MTKDKTIVKNDSEKEIESRVEIVEEKKSNRIVNIFKLYNCFFSCDIYCFMWYDRYQLFF